MGPILIAVFTTEINGYPVRIIMLLLLLLCSTAVLFLLFSYFKNPSYGNAGEIEEDLLRQKNELRTKEWECCVIKEQVH